MRGTLSSPDADIWDALNKHFDADGHSKLDMSEQLGQHTHIVVTIYKLAEHGQRVGVTTTTSRTNAIPGCQHLRTLVLSKPAAQDLGKTPVLAWCHPRTHVAFSIQEDGELRTAIGAWCRLGNEVDLFVSTPADSDSLLQRIQDMSAESAAKYGSDDSD